MNRVLKASLYILLSFIASALLASKAVLPAPDLARKALFVGFLILLVVLFEKKNLAYFGFKSPSRQRLLVLLSFLGVFFIVVLFHGVPVPSPLPSATAALVLFILAFLEEVFFCGYAQVVLQEALGKIEAIVIASLLFCAYAFSPQPMVMAELLVLRLFLSSLFSADNNLSPVLAGRWLHVALRLL